MMPGEKVLEIEGAVVRVGDVVVVFGQPPSIQAVRVVELVAELRQEIVLPVSFVQSDVAFEDRTGVTVRFVGQAM